MNVIYLLSISFQTSGTYNYNTISKYIYLYITSISTLHSIFTAFLIEFSQFVSMTCRVSSFVIILVTSIRRTIKKNNNNNKKKKKKKERKEN